jgi:hypothetical protein
VDVLSITYLGGPFAMQSSKGAGTGELDHGVAPPEAVLAAAMMERCQRFLAPLLAALDTHVDRRLMRTAAQAIPAILRHRTRPTALLLSELGEVLAGPTHAPAGTKRLANLLHSPNWRATEIEQWLIAQAQGPVEAAADAVPEGRALCILDGSVIEKPESATADGLRPVRSSKARRLGRPRPKLGPGYYGGPPGHPVVVPGWQWLAAVVAPWTDPGARRPLTLGAWHTYQHPAPVASSGAAGTGAALPPMADATLPSASAEGGTEVRPSAPVPVQRDREAQATVLAPLVAAWGSARLLHVWDRGLSGAPWLDHALDRDWHFVVRWKKGNRLRSATAPSVGNPSVSTTARDRDGIAAWKLTRGRRAWDTRVLPNPRNPTQPLRVAVLAQPVCLMHRDTPLWLVVARLGKGSGRRAGSLEPLRLVTTEPVESAAQCWRIVAAYLARWEVEQVLRFGKSELGIESVRVRAGEPRRKLFALVSLAYAFLVLLVGDGGAPILTPLLRWAHRTGRQARQTWRPLYRVRAALANLWSAHPPALHYPT